MRSEGAVRTRVKSQGELAEQDKLFSLDGVEVVEEVSSSDGVTGRGGRNSFPALFLFLTRRLSLIGQAKFLWVEMFLFQP